MKILITGGLGFIGYKLAKYLKNDQNQIHILDIKEPSEWHDKTFRYFSFDMRDTHMFSKLDRDYDYVFHLAAQPGGYYSLINPQEDCTLNCLSTVNLVSYFKQFKPKKIIFSSSMAVYGNCEMATEDTVENPISFYGVSKLAGEKYIKLIKEQANIPYTIFRIFATYGYGQDLGNQHQGIVSIYLKYALDSGIVPITGKSDRVRCLIHVEDVCRALAISITDKRTDNEVFNVLNEKSETPQSIIEEISKIIGKKISILEKEGYIGDQEYITGSNERLTNLGWKPEISLLDGLKEFYEGIKNEK